MSDAEPEHQEDHEHRVTPLELFFDLVFVFAITQVTSLLVVVYEVLRHREHRVQVRHPELAA